MKIKRTIILMLTFSIIAACFAGCSFNSTDPLDNTKTKIEDNKVAITGYTDRTTITEFTVPDEIDGKPVTKIADFGLCNAESLTRITIGKNVEEIESWSMTNNQRLTEFVVDEENQYFTAVDGVLFTKDMKTLVYYPPAKGVSFDKYGNVVLETDKETGWYSNEPTYDIPEGVETIAAKAFYKCYFVNITSVPSSIKSIGEKAFFRTSELENFLMPASIEFIGKDAFAYDDKLSKIDIGENIKEIGEYAFFNCTGITEINVAKKESDIKLGKKWQPTEKGRIKKDCTVNFKQ